MASRTLTIQLSERAFEALKELAEREGVPRAQVLRRALAVLKFLEDERMSGRKVVIADEHDKILKELVG